MVTEQSNEVTVTTDGPPAPSGVSATVQSNSQIDVSWTDNGLDHGQYHIQIQRDEGSWVDPAGGPTTVGSNTTSTSYGPNSDYAYDKQVGIDSSFRFRVRSEADGATSGWAYSARVYTDPVPPRILDVSRPDDNTVRMKVEKRADNQYHFDYLRIEFREDTGGGYGGWQHLDQISETEGTRVSGQYKNKGDVVTLEAEANTTYQGGNAFGENSRVQFRLQARQRTPNRASYYVGSQWIYHDYGNEGNVYFHDDFSSDDISAWDTSNNSPSTGTGEQADTGISGPVTGGYFLKGYGQNNTNSTWVQKGLGDLSGETDVHVRCRMAVGSLDGSNEDFGIDWYDGSSWHELKYLHWEYNEQGWVEIHAQVPDSWLSTDNSIRVGTTTSDGMYGGDTFAVDEVIVADHVHEYTRPAAPDTLNVSKTDNGLKTSWSDVATFVSSGYVDSKYEINYENPDESTRKRRKVGTSHTETSLRDGDEYTIHVHTAIRQPRHGNSDTRFILATGSNTTAVTPFQKPTNVTLSRVDDQHLTADWDDTANYGEYRVRIERDGAWTDPNNANPSRTPSVGTSSVDLYAESDADYAGNVGVDSVFDVAIRHQTEHGSSAYAGAPAVATTPVPPENPRVSRPSANEITVEWDNASDCATKTAIFYRKDTGGGYGSWTWTGHVDQNTTKGETRPHTFTQSNTDWLDPDARYQFKLRHESYRSPQGRIDSDFNYASYGNDGNVYFSDDFSSGDTSAWTSVGGSDTTVQSGSNGYLGISGPKTGSNYLFTAYDIEGSYANSHYAVKELGDLSGETGVHIRARMATGSMDYNGERTVIDWYDGSSWQELRGHSWAYNRQGWAEVHVDVPDSMLSTDNRVRFGGRDGLGHGDYHALDELIVSDVVHEYTRPAAPSSLSTSTSEGEITANWTNEARLLDVGGTETNVETHIKPAGGSWDYDYPPFSKSSRTWSGLTDGRDHDIEISAEYIQARRGSRSNWFETGDLTATVTTPLPPPSLSASITTGVTEIDLSGTVNDNNPDGTVTFTNQTDSRDLASRAVGSSLTVTDTGVDGGTTYDYVLQRSTPDATSTSTVVTERAPKTLTRAVSRSTSTTINAARSVSTARSASLSTSSATTVGRQVDTNRTLTSSVDTVAQFDRGGVGAQRTAANTAEATIGTRTALREVFDVGLTEHTIQYDPDRVLFHTEWFAEPPLRRGANTLAVRLGTKLDGPGVKCRLEVDTNGDGERDYTSDWIEVTDERIPITFDADLSDATQLRIVFRDVRLPDVITHVETSYTTR